MIPCGRAVTARGGDSSYPSMSPLCATMYSIRCRCAIDYDHYYIYSCPSWVWMTRLGTVRRLVVIGVARRAISCTAPYYSCFSTLKMAARRQSSTTSLAKYARVNSPDLSNRSLDFCNAFWGPSDGGVDVLFARMRGALRTVEELKAFWKERYVQESIMAIMSLMALAGLLSRRTTRNGCRSWPNRP